MGVINSDILVNNADMNFLYNRAIQMQSCLKDGNFTFFYYNDFNGAGYGTSFFYGGITLYPFLIVINYGKRAFLLAYIVVTLILMQLGILTLYKRFSENYKNIAILPMMSVVFLTCLTKTGSYANYLTLALSLFFLAFAVDFFRDRKSFIPVSLLYLILISSHLVTALLCFIFTVLLLVLYFDKSRLKDYAYFLIVTVLLCSYTIINMLYHSDILNRQLIISSKFKDAFSNKDYSVILYFADTYPFKGILYNIIFSDYSHNGFSYINTALLLFCLILCRIRKLSVREFIVFILSIVFIILSVHKVWFTISIYLTGWIQYPLRYAPYIIIVFILISFRYCSKKRVYVLAVALCAIDLLVFPSIGSVDEGYSNYITYEDQIMNGEYLDSSFLFDNYIFEDLSSSLRDNHGFSYDYTINKDKLYVNIDNYNNDLVLRFPKLYYKGYVLESTTSDESFDCIKGYSQFIEADIGDYSGELVLYYKHPDFLVLVYALCIAFTVVLIMIYVSVLFNECQNNKICKK